MSRVPYLSRPPRLVAYGVIRTVPNVRGATWPVSQPAIAVAQTSAFQVCRIFFKRRTADLNPPAGGQVRACIYLLPNQPRRE